MTINNHGKDFVNIWILYLKKKVGGGAHCCHELASALEGEKSASVTTYCLSETEFKDWLTGKGLRTKSLVAVPNISYRGFKSLAVLSRRFREELRVNPPDVVVIPMTSILHIPAIWQIKKSYAKIISLVHEVDYRKGNTNFMGRILRKPRDFELRFSDLHVALSRFTYSALISKKIGVSADYIVHPVFLSQKRKKSIESRNKKRRRILFFGRPTKPKGVWRLLDAFMHLTSREHLDLDLELELCLGLDDYREVEGLRGVRVCRGYIDEISLLEKIVDADAVALPYDHASQSGVAALALGVGCPCVVTPVGGLPEQILDGFNGFVAKDLTPKAFADALAMCFEDDERYLTLLRNISEDNLCRLSWSPLAKHILEIGGNRRSLSHKRPRIMEKV